MSGQIEYIRTFLAVMTEGGFSAAGRTLGLSPTIVTRHVAELEAELGVQLFTRTTRKVDLTDAGRLYADRVKPILHDLDAANEEVRHRQMGLSGPLRISAPMSFGTRLLPDIVTQFRVLHPAVHLQIQLTDRFVGIAEEGYDLALRISEPPQDLSTIWRKICPIDRVLVASPTYLDVRGRPTNPAQLQDHDCMHYTHAPATPLWRFLNDGDETRIRLTPCFTCNNGDLLARLAQQGEGIALLPRFIVEEALHDNRLESLLTHWHAPDIWLTTTVPPYEQLPAKVAAFISFVEAYMSDPMKSEP
ncbi:LysR substrate-binding domain-containing protein [Roseobacter sp. A03A-229]